LLGFVYAGGWWLMNGMAFFSGMFLTAYTIFFILGGGLLGAWLWVLIKLPSGLAAKFDVIKNKIAAQEIADSQTFALELARFFVDNFSYFRFDLFAVQIAVKEKITIVYPESYSSCLAGLDDLNQLSKTKQSITNLGKVNLNGKNCHRYLLPFWFRDEWLGYALLISDTRLDKFNLKFLKELEDHFIDDQLKHVLHYERLKH
jgi:hypothetical protein